MQRRRTVAEPLESDRSAQMGCFCKFWGPRRWWHPTMKALVFSVCLTVCIHHTMCEGAEVIAAVGQTAILSPPTSSRMFSFTWLRGPPTGNAEENIFSYLVSDHNETKGRQYTGRETGQPDGSLKISDVLTNYSGSYTLSLKLMADGSSVTYSKVLKVLEPVSIPVVHAVFPDPMKNSSLVLFCNASGSSVSYQWYQRGRVVVSGGRISLSANSQTLILSPYDKSDTGTIFTCRAFNDVSNFSSVPYIVTSRTNGPNKPVLPIWAIGLLVMLTITLLVFIIALVRYIWVKRRRARKRKQKQMRSKQDDLESSSSDDSSSDEENGSGKDNKDTTVNVEPMGSEDMPAPGEKEEAKPPPKGKKGVKPLPKKKK